jgi:hypothetical protein
MGEKSIKKLHLKWKSPTKKEIQSQNN